MKLSNHRLAAVTLAALALAGAGTAAQSPRFEERMNITASRLNGSDYYLTFSGPIALPGVSLGAGRYLFSREAGNVVRVTRGASPVVMVHTIPVSRARATAQHEITFGDPLAAGAPRRVVAWFLPGEMTGRQLIYPGR